MESFLPHTGLFAIAVVSLMHCGGCGKHRPEYYQKPDGPDTRGDSSQSGSEELLFVAVGNVAYVQGLIYSQDGKRLISSAAGSSVRVWDTETWELLQRIDHGKTNAGVPAL